MSVALNQQHMAVKYVLNHDIMHCTAEGVVGNHLYSGRALGITHPRDIIQLHPDLQPLWQEIKDHYRRIGLPHSRNVIWNLDLKQLANHAGFKPSVFFFGPQECCIWGDSQWFETVRFINSKNNFISLAQALGMDVPMTHCFDRASLVTEADLDRTVYPCYLKAAISVSGVGIYRCADAAELAQALTKFEADTPVQIQQEVLAESFLNLQYQVINGHLTRLAATEQILDGFVHQGNRYPASHEPWEVVDPMAEWLAQRGIQGILAFDVAISQTSRGLRFPAIECNPRFNGASYPTLIAAKMGISEWCAVTLHTHYNSLTDIDLCGLEYDNDNRKGVIIVNWGTILAGKIVLLIAGSQEDQQVMRDELEQRLDITHD
jgi:hypothetical protein